VLSFLAPDLRLTHVLELTVDLLAELGIRGLLLDLDCTLKDYHATRVPAPVRSWLVELREHGIGLCLLSNGKAGRIGRLAAELGLPFVARALKPFPFGCHKGLKKLGVPVQHAAVVGDQLFADILAGRLAGIFTILVRPTSPEEPWFTRVKRPLERRVLRLLDASPRPQRRRLESPV